jgi:5-methylcytosine-specific restriction endonuclease McrA
MIGTDATLSSISQSRNEKLIREIIGSDFVCFFPLGEGEEINTFAHLPHSKSILKIIIMNNKHINEYRAAIRKVRQFVSERKLTVSNKEHHVIIAFLKYNGIKCIDTKKHLKKRLLELYLEKHHCLQFQFKPKIKKVQPIQNAKLFYETKEWQRLRRMVIKAYGVKCMKCGIKNTEMHVDHIRPISKYPEYKLCFGNLQVLCKSCNLSKSNIDETDYRSLGVLNAIAMRNTTKSPKQ